MGLVRQGHCRRATRLEWRLTTWTHILACGCLVSLSSCATPHSQHANNPCSQGNAVGHDTAMPGVSQVEMSPKPLDGRQSELQQIIPSEKNVSQSPAQRIKPAEDQAPSRESVGDAPGTTAHAIPGQTAPTAVAIGAPANTNVLVQPANGTELAAIATAEPLPPPKPDPPAGDPQLTNQREATVLTIPDVLEYTLQHNPVLRSRQHEVEAAQARVITARLLPNPQLTLDSEGSTDGSDRYPVVSPDHDDGPAPAQTPFADQCGNDRRMRSADGAKPRDEARAN